MLAEGSSAMADGGENIRIHLGRESMDRTTITDMTLERYTFGKTKFIKYAILLTILLTLAHNTLFLLIDTLSSSHFTLYSYLCIFCLILPCSIDSTKVPQNLVPNTSNLARMYVESLFHLYI